MDETSQTPVYLKIQAITTSAVSFLLPEGATLTIAKVGS